MSEYISCSDASSRRNGASRAQEQQGQQGRQGQPAVDAGEEAAGDGEEAAGEGEAEAELLEDYKRVAQAQVVPLHLGQRLGRGGPARVRSVAAGFSFAVLLLEGGGAMAHGQD